jgi:hypothetical protein
MPALTTRLWICTFDLSAPFGDLRSRPSEVSRSCVPLPRSNFTPNPTLAETYTVVDGKNGCIQGRTQTIYLELVGRVRSGYPVSITDSDDKLTPLHNLNAGLRSGLVSTGNISTRFPSRSLFQNLPYALGLVFGYDTSIGTSPRRR